MGIGEGREGVLVIRVLVIDQALLEAERRVFVGWE